MLEGFQNQNGGARVTSNSRAVFAPSATNNQNLGPGGVITGALPCLTAGSKNTSLARNNSGGSMVAPIAGNCVGE
jgi:hypothetical protein